MVPRLYFLIKSFYWLCKGSADDDKEDRYDLVLAFSGYAVSVFAMSIAPLFVGFLLGLSGAEWVWPMFGLWL